MSTENGGPAFPHMREWIDANTSRQLTDGGMTLRDYFAAKAMPISAAIFEKGQWKYIADHAYQLADAMLKAREA